jgi:hypothetical protein
MRDAVTLAVWLGGWLTAAAVYYFWLSETIVGLLAGIALLVAVPVWAWLGR